MAEDVNVKEIELLNVYGRKLHELRAASVGVAVLLDHQLRKIKDDYTELANNLSRLSNNSAETCRDIQERYQRAIKDCGEEAREIIGTTDLEAQLKLEVLQVRVETTQNAIKTLQMKLKNAGNKTKNYVLQMNNMTDNCLSIIKRQTELLEKYKDLKK